MCATMTLTGRPNYLFKNHGDGTFSDVTEIAGVGNGSQYSFQGLWLDYDEDGWQDLFVINDRMPASNAMYRNNGDGTFQDVTLELGLEDFFFSMCNTGGDYDNDGDIDLFVTNNPFGHRLYDFDNGTYSNVASELGVAMYDHSWSATWIDYDNNGWQDLHIACSPFWSENGEDRFYESHENGSVFIQNDLIGFYDTGTTTHSVAVGDYNNDGMFDVLSINDDPHFSKLHKSVPGDNNYLKFLLEGTVSNRDGVGSKVTCWTNALMQTRYTYCGESYLSQHSKSEIFGLGNAETVDSLLIQWPSGIVDFYTNLVGNQNYNFVEGAAEEPSINLNGETTICAGDSVLLTIPSYYTNVQWNDGTAGLQNWVTEAGVYSCTATTNSGISVESDNIAIGVWVQPTFSLTTNEPSCFGDDDGSILLVATNETLADSIVWSTSAIGEQITGLTSADYGYTIHYGAGCINQNSASLTQPDSLTLELSIQNTSCFEGSDGSITVGIIGGTEPFELDTYDADIENLVAGTYDLTVIDGNNCQTVQAAVIESPALLEVDFTTEDASCAGENNGSIEVAPFGGTPPYTMSLNDVDPANLFAGQYDALVTDSLGCDFGFTFDINQPDDIDYLITISSSTGGADGVASIEISGTFPPFAIEWEDGSNGESVDGLAFGQYEVIITDANDCQWIVPFWIDMVGITEFFSSQILAYPNPFAHSFRIKSNTTFEDIRMYDAQGRSIEFEEQGSGGEVIVVVSTQQPNGIYTLICIDTKGVTHVKRLTRLLD